MDILIGIGVNVIFALFLVLLVYLMDRRHQKKIIDRIKTRGPVGELLIWEDGRIEYRKFR